MRRATALLSVLAPTVVLAFAAPAAAGAPCDPSQVEPHFLGQVPSLYEAVPNPGGEEGEVTAAQANRYMKTVDRASNRVISGTLKKKTWQGRTLRWAIAGHPRHLGPRRLEMIRKAAQRLRDPQTSPRRARRIARRNPAILWVAAGVHGEEESGTDASLRVLHELADRNDCAARRILDKAIVVLLPLQNPDGREAVGPLSEQRVNGYGFDLNRDWVSRISARSRRQLSLMRRYPGPLFIDAHENIAHSDFFFPPNPDPIYHEISRRSLRWMKGYGAAMAAEFDRQAIGHFSRDVYDLLYIGYGDTATTTGFLSAGMSFEAGVLDAISRSRLRALSGDLDFAFTRRVTQQKVLKQWAASYREALLQGRGAVLNRTS